MSVTNKFGGYLSFCPALAELKDKFLNPNNAGIENAFTAHNVMGIQGKE